jgi:hypothetical protein
VSILQPTGFFAFADPAELSNIWWLMINIFLFTFSELSWVSPSPRPSELHKGLPAVGADDESQLYSWKVKLPCFISLLSTLEPNSRSIWRAFGNIRKSTDSSRYTVSWSDTFVWPSHRSSTPKRINRSD